MICFVEKSGRVKSTSENQEGVRYFRTAEEAKGGNCPRVVDLDEAVSLMEKFTAKTLTPAKKFKKFAKKMNGKNPDAQKEKVRNWAKSNIYGIFEQTFLLPLFPDKAYERLSEEDLLTITVGGFIVAHSIAEELDAPMFFKTMARDIALKAYAHKE